MRDRAQLHLVDSNGTSVSLAIRYAVESAYHWVCRDYPNVDRASIADWAEAVAASMQVRGSAIESPTRYAYAALKGKVRDWLRTASAQEQDFGLGRDLERIGGSNGSFQGKIDRKILFDQLQATLADRDRVILVLLLTDKTAQEIAAELNTTYPAARKAIQRVKERIGAILGESKPKNEGDHGPAQFCESKG